MTIIYIYIYIYMCKVMIYIYNSRKKTKQRYNKQNPAEILINHDKSQYSAEVIY